MFAAVSSGPASTAEWKFHQDNWALAVPAVDGWVEIEAVYVPEPSLALSQVDGNVTATLTSLKINPETGRLDDNFIRVLDENSVGESERDGLRFKVVKVSGRRTEFKGVPAYELLCKTVFAGTGEDQRFEGMTRALFFMADDCFHKIIICTFGATQADDPIIQNLLAGFRFLQTPKTPAVPDPDDVSDTLGYKIGYWGFHVVLIILAIYVGRRVLRALFGKKRPDKAR